MDRRRFLKTAGLAAAAMPLWMTLTPEKLWSAIPSDIKITGVKVWPVTENNEVFVKVYTNKGVVGLGECSVHRKTITLANAVMDLERVIVGKDPTKIELLWQGMYRWPRWRGGPVLNAAISGVEVALWDILGKLLDVPVYKLLGGAARDKIRLYQASSGAEGVLAVKELGFTATKTGVSGLTRPLKRPWDVKAAAKNFEEMRLAVGDDFDIGTDAHGNCTPAMALEYCKAIEDYRPMWIEEPVQPEANDALEWLGNHTTVPMATGERHFTKWGFEDMISRNLVSYVQPDVIICGGISETKKIAAMAEAKFIDVAIHNPGSLVGTLASLHVDACTSNCVIQEFKYKYVEPSGWQEDLFYGTRINYKDGFAMLPDKPGIGTDMDEKVAEAHLVTMEEDANPQTYFEDGSVRDH